MSFASTDQQQKSAPGRFGVVQGFLFAHETQKQTAASLSFICLRTNIYIYIYMYIYIYIYVVLRMLEGPCSPRSVGNFVICFFPREGADSLKRVYVQTRTMTIYTEAKINWKMTRGTDLRSIFQMLRKSVPHSPGDRF